MDKRLSRIRYLSMRACFWPSVIGIATLYFFHLMRFEDWIKNAQQSTTNMTDKLDLKVRVATPNAQGHIETLPRTAVKRTGSGSDTKVETKTKSAAVRTATANGKKSTNKSTNKKIINPRRISSDKERRSF